MSAAEATLRPRVLVALDGSPAASTALPIARLVAAQLGATLSILHVAPQPLSEDELRALLHLDPSDWEGLEAHVVVGDAAAMILEMIGDPRIELVVLTTHGREIEPGRHLGRVAEAVVSRTVQPVLLVRPEAAVGPHAHVSEVRQLLLPLDGTPTTAAALAPAIELAGKLDAAIDLLYVAGPGRLPPAEPGSIAAPRYVDQPQHEWPHWAQEVIAHLCACCGNVPPGVSIRVFLAQGDIGEEIARFAAEHHEDAIVLVRRSRLEPGRARALRAVLDRTPCPALLVGGPAGMRGVPADSDARVTAH